MHNKKSWIIGASICMAAIIVVSAGVAWTSRTEFCLSCHEMRLYQAELASSPHARDAAGNAIGCPACHIPNSNVARMLGAKTWMGLKDLWVHNVNAGTPLNRAEMQPVARRFTDDANCRHCHQDLMRNAAQTGPVSAEGRLSHANYLGENGKSRNGCVGCHINVAHLPPFDARIPANAKFAAKLKEARS